MSELFLSPPSNFIPKVVVSTCLLECNNSILFLKRSAGCVQPFTWCIPGGKLELNETPQAGLLRELQEELSLLPDAQNIKEKLKLFVRHSQMDYILYIYYWPLTTLPNITLRPEEHVDFIWQPLDQIDALPLLEGQGDVLSMILSFISKEKESEIN